MEPSSTVMSRVVKSEIRWEITPSSYRECSHDGQICLWWCYHLALFWAGAWRISRECGCLQCTSMSATLSISRELAGESAASIWDDSKGEEVSSLGCYRCISCLVVLVEVCCIGAVLFIWWVFISPFSLYLFHLPSNVPFIRLVTMMMLFCCRSATLGCACTVPITSFHNIYAVVSLLWMVLFCGGVVLPVCSGIIVSIVPRYHRPVSSSLALVVFNLLGYCLSLVLSGWLMEVTRWSYMILILCLSVVLTVSVFCVL
jgi:hypothetical protein